MIHALAAALAITAPAAPDTVSRPVGLGRSVTVGGLRVRPLLIVEDSRCPMNARCIHAGRLVLRARLGAGRHARIADMTLGRPAPHGGGTVTLVGALPDRMAGRPLRPSAYRFTFSARR